MSSGGSRKDALGYNQQEIEEIGVGINSMAERAGEAITTAIKLYIVDKVAEEWYSEIAVKYFEDFKDQLKRKEVEITDIFQQFSDRIKEGGDAWAEETGGVAPTMPAVETVNLDLDVSPIKTDDAGNRYISEDLDSKVKSYVETARTEILQTFGQLKTEAYADSAFFGGGQAEAIQTAADQLGDAVNEILDELISGDGSLVSEIANYKSEYSDVATKNASSFEDSAFK